MSFTRYPDYKDSGVEWLSSIPRLWGFKRINMIASLNDDALPETTDGEQEITYVDIGSVSLSAGVEKFEVFTFKDAPSRARRKVKDGDVIISTVRTYLKAIAPIVNPPENLVVSTGFAVLRAKSDVKSIFTKYALQSNGFLDEIISRSTGVSYPAINASEIGFIKIPVPSLPEQTQIANFLDQETTKIDALVVEQLKLIELLKEKRQAVISNAVTKGLDRQVKMKDSGVEWLGDIPEHWNIKKLKFVVDVMASNVDKKTYDGDIPCSLCNYTDVYYNEVIKEDMEFMSATATPEQIKKFTLKQGDVIITKDSESPDDIAIAAYVPMDLIGVVCGYHLSIIRATEINGMFVKRLFDSHYLKSKFATLANGLTRYGLGQHSINNVYIPIPPDEEQQQIVKFINKTCNEIDDLIDKSKTSINLLTERRSALISAAVTGQIDVRNSYGN